ncbi:hypothetical protein LB505_010304 [Fusarium chuoi]|nr:hypothetical protein LB505_010304 [Fusarium chuoi]
MAALIVLRFFAGSFGSSPLSNAGGVIADMFEARDRGLATALFAMAPFLGPTLGLYLQDGCWSSSHYYCHTVQDCDTSSLGPANQRAHCSSNLTVHGHHLRNTIPLLCCLPNCLPAGSRMESRNRRTCFHWHRRGNAICSYWDYLGQ